MNKNMIQKCLVASVILCASLSAQAQYNAGGDLIVSFRNTTATPGNDYIVDLGQWSPSAGVQTVVVPSTVTALGGASLNNVAWSVAGISADFGSLFLSSASQFKNQSDDNFGAMQGAIATVGGNILSGNSATVPASDAASYTVAGAFGTFSGSASLEGNGVKTLGLYQTIAGSTKGQNAELVAYVSLGQDGTFTFTPAFTPVPEAAGFGMVAAGAMMVMFAFNTMRARQATR